MERTLALVKPDVCGRPRIQINEETDEEGNVTKVPVQVSLDQTDEIIERIEAAGFTVVSQSKVVLTKDRANEFYNEHRGKVFFNTLTNFMSSGTTCALMLEKEGAIKSWRELVEAKDNGIRATFGTDATLNAVHGSDSVYSAARELEFFFPAANKLGRTLAVVQSDKVDEVVSAVESLGFVVLGRADKDKTVALCLEGMNAALRLQLAIGAELAKYGVEQGAEKDMKVWFPNAFAVEQTLALIKPETAGDVAAVGGIMRSIEAAGFTVLTQKRMQLTQERAELFYAEHKGKPFFKHLTKHMSSGPIEALVLAKPAAIKTWQVLIKTLITAKQEPGLVAPPGCVEWREQSPFHGSYSPAGATREIRFYFPSMRPQALLTTAPSKFLQATPPPSPGIHKTILRGLAALCKQEDPGSQVNAVKWLGQWLLDNNPGGPSVSDPDVDWTPAPPPPPTPTTVRMKKLPNQGSKVSHPEFGEPIIAFVLGGPGSGKGTQCAKIVQDFGFTHLSAGDLLRAEVASGSAFGKKLEADMAAGALVPPKVVLHLLKKAMTSGIPKSRFLIDGFPRTRDQAFMFEKEIGRCNLVLHFDCDEDVMKARLLQRGKTSGRVDDNEEAIVKRFETYKEQSKPVIDFYHKLGLVANIDATQTPDVVYKAVKPVVKPKVVTIIGGPGSNLSAQCAAAASKFGYAHVSMQKTITEVLAAGGANAADLQALLDTGYDLSLDAVMELVDRTLSRTRSMNIIFEGFPRTKEEALAYEARYGSQHMVINLDCDNSQQPAYARKSAPVLQLYSGSGVLHNVDATAAAGTVRRHIAAKFTPEVVFVVGGEGVDENAICTEIAAKYDGYTHLSMDDVLKCSMIGSDDHGAMIGAMIKNKQAIPVDLTLAVLRRAMEASGGVVSGHPKFVFSGFPIKLEHATSFEASVGTCTKLLYVKGKDGKLADNKAAVVDYYALKGKVQAITGDATAAQAACDSLCYDVTLTWGGPGCPVSELSAQIAAKYGMTYMCYDEIVQSALARGSAEGVAWQACIDKGKVVTDKLKLSVVKAAMASSKSRRFLLQGYPKTADQALAFCEEVAPVRCVLHFSGKDDAELARSCVLAENAARGRVTAPDADPEEVAAALERQVQAVLAAVANQPWDAPQEEVAGPGQNWAKSLADKPGFVIKKGDIEESIEEGIAKRIVSYKATLTELTTHFSSAENQTSAGIKDVPFASNPMGKVARLLRSTIVAIVGAAGSGKRGAATQLCREEGYKCISVPQLHDAAVAEGSVESAVILRARALGRTVPAATSVALISQSILDNDGHRFLLDGFPQITGAGAPFAHDQLFLVETEIGAVDRVVHFAAPAEARAKRMASSKSWPLSANKFEDAEELYTQQSMPTVAFAERIGSLSTVDSSSTPEATYDGFKKVADSLKALDVWM